MFGSAVFVGRLATPILRIIKITKIMIKITILVTFSSFVTLASTRLRLSEVDADASKQVGVLTKYY